MEVLAQASSLIVSQKKEWGEILTGFETKNRYTILTPDGEAVYSAAEHGGNWLLRILLKAYRSFEMAIMREDGSTVLNLKRPFRFYFHEMEISDAEGKHLGMIKRRFSLLRRIYSVYDEQGQEVLELFGPILHPWTFNIIQDENEYGKITKKWSGLGKEMFTDADNFGITFPPELNINLKAVLLGAVFLIDFVHFENKND